MATNVLNIQPQRNVDLATFNNASWTDSFPFVVAATAAGYPASTNIGNGAFFVISVAPQTVLGSYTVQILAPVSGSQIARVSASAPDGTIIAIGNVDVPVLAGGIVFAVAHGSTPYAVGDSFSMSVLPAALDVTGITFALMLRSQPADAEISLSASTADGSIANGGTTGQVGMRVSTAVMRGLPPGTYAYDLIASADGYDVLAYQGSVTHIQGVTALAS